MSTPVKPGRYVLPSASKKRKVVVEVEPPLELAPTEKHVVPPRDHSAGIAGGGSFSEG
jgi:hypothetical protein